MHHLLIAKAYHPEPYQAFFVKDPKLRHIHKATVRDRVAHQALFRILYPVVDASLSSSVYSARKNFGTHRGVKKLFETLRKYSNNWKREQWVLKCDVKKFFDSVEHAIFLKKIEQYQFDANTLALIKTILFSFETSPGKGLPLGNVTSQLFANIYFNDFDWNMKRHENIRAYFRYCDDIVIVLTDRSKAAPLLAHIRESLCSISLTLHPHKIHVRKTRQGIDFLGYIVMPYCVVLRTTTKKRILKRAKCAFDSKSESAIAVFDSYLGVATHAQARVVTKQLLWYKSVL